MHVVHLKHFKILLNGWLQHNTIENKILHSFIECTFELTDIVIVISAVSFVHALQSYASTLYTTTWRRISGVTSLFNFKCSVVDKIPVIGFKSK